jgi:predicted nucleic acid-binding protein
MSRCIIDASMAAAWCLPDEGEGGLVWLDAVARNGATVPALWPFEINNVLLVAHRRKRIAEPDVLRARTLLGRLPILIEPAPTPAIASETFDLARRFALSFYDASYLESAIRNRLPLGSFDQPLCKAAKACDIRLSPEK